jgi:hypothetical protein
MRPQNPPSNTPFKFTDLAIDAETLNSAAQSSIDALTCNAIGGLATLSLEAMRSRKLKAWVATSMPNANVTKPFLDASVLAALPKGPLTVTSEGNVFTVELSNAKVTVNGLSYFPFAVLTTVHSECDPLNHSIHSADEINAVVLTTFAFFYALPIYIVLGAIQRISVMIGHPVDERKNQRWRVFILFGLFMPSALVGIAVGIIGMGTAKRFGTTHGVCTILFHPAFIYYLLLSKPLQHNTNVK